MSFELLSIALRALGLLCLFQAAGAAFFLTLFRRRTAAIEGRVVRLARVAALVGIGALLAHQLLEAVRLSGEASGLWDASLQRLAWSSSGGNATLFELLALGIVVLGLSRSGREGAIIASTGAAIAACAFALTGHTSVHAYRALLAPLLIVHLLLIAFWVGALLPLSIATRFSAREDAIALLREFSALAGVLVPLIAVAGLGLAVTLIHPARLWLAPYGLLVLLKMGLFVVLLVLAAWNRWRLVPALGRDQATGASAAALRRSIAAEYVILVMIFTATAFLTGWFSPARVARF